MPGTSILKAEITNIGKRGFWIWVNSKEFFLDYNRYPWFKKSSISQILNVQLIRGHCLCWPDLDVDLEIDSLRHPDRYPLVFR